MHKLKLHHIARGKFIKKIGGFIPIRSHGLPKLSQMSIRGGAIPAHKKIYDSISGGRITKRITPLSYKF